MTPNKVFAGYFILFIKESNNHLPLYIDYHSFNKLTITNCYLLLLISKFSDWLSNVKYFTKPNLTSVYYWLQF